MDLRNKRGYSLLGFLGLLLVVIVLFFGINNNAQNVEMNYSELKDSSQEISYDNLLQYPDRHGGKIISQHGRIIQTVDGGFLLASTSTYAGRGSREYNRDVVWISTQNQDSLIEKDSIVTVYGVFTGTKTYETEGSEYATVPSMTLEHITDKIEVTISAKTDTSDMRGYQEIEPVRVDQICLGSNCVENVQNNTFRVPINKEYRIQITDSELDTVNTTEFIGSKSSFSYILS